NGRSMNAEIVARLQGGGETLRDKFAGQALAGWLASFPPDAAVKPINAAAFAYEVADAMLAARQSQEGEDDDARREAYEWLERYAYSSAPEAQQEPHEVLHVYDGDGGVIIRENGNISTFGAQTPAVHAAFEAASDAEAQQERPSEQAVTEAMVEQMCQTPFIEGFTPTTDEWQRCETV